MVRVGQSCMYIYTVYDRIFDFPAKNTVNTYVYDGSGPPYKW